MPPKITEDSLKLVQTYGLGMFMAVVVLGVMLILIRYILKSNDRREERSDKREQRFFEIINTSLGSLNTASQSLLTAIQNLQQLQSSADSAAQARYDTLMGAGGHQRAEHTQMLEKMIALNDKAEVAAQHIIAINARMDELECKAK